MHDFDNFLFTFQIASAVQHLHSLNIAHRDLKPENLLYKDKSDNSPIKLCDFGFAKEDKGDLTTPQFTPYYVSPQVLEAQRRHKKERASMVINTHPYTYDKSCDMWSLGVIIYILLCGYPPFYSEHPSSRRTIDKTMRRKIMNASYTFPSEEWLRVSDSAKDIVKRLLCVDPFERMQVSDLINHPWLAELEQVPDTVLHSPLHMISKETQNVHNDKLRKMRIPERIANLKPLESAINPMLVNRQSSNRQCLSPVQSFPSRDNNPPTLKSLRDLIAECICFQEISDVNVDATPSLISATKNAIEKNSSSEILLNTLSLYGWENDEYTKKVNLKDLAYSIKDIIEACKTEQLKGK